MRIHDRYIPRLPKRQSEVLLFLAENGPSTKYKVSDETKIRYPVVHLSMKQLEKKGLVLLVSRRAGKTGAETLVFDLTQDGLLLLAVTQRKFRLSRYAESHKESDPAFFEVWEYYRAKGIQSLMEKMFRFLSGIALTEEKPGRVRPTAGRTYLQYLAEGRDALTLEDIGNLLSLENMERYFAAIVEHEGLYPLLIGGVEKSIRNYRRRMEEKQRFLDMLKELHALVQEGRDAGVKQHEIELRLMEAIRERLPKVMAPYSVPQ